MENKIFYIIAGIWTLNTLINFFIGEFYTFIQLGLVTIVLWMWAYLLNQRGQR